MSSKAVILFAPKPISQSYVETKNDLVEVELGCVSCPKQNHIFVQPISIDTPPLIITYSLPLVTHINSFHYQ